MRRLSAPYFWEKRNALSTLLLPASWLYSAGVRLREKYTKIQTAPVPVLCIGNAVAGGAGKTPTALAIAARLMAQGRDVFFLSRGYGGSHKGPLRVDPARHEARDVGDEPLLLAALAPTIVSRDRIAGARLAAKLGAQIIVMDDGFQNPGITKDFSLLVVDAAYGFGNGRLLPAGPMREPSFQAVDRADAVLFIGAPFALDDPKKPVFTARLTPSPQSLAWRGQSVVGFAGIARPEKFHATLEEIGCNVTDFFHFPDHHVFTADEMKQLEAHANAQGSRLVTTAKDAARLEMAWRQRVQVITVNLEIDQPSLLDALIEQALNAA